MTTLTTDAAGLPIRNKGDKIVVEGRRATVVKNLGLVVLCPCPDMLRVRFDDNSEESVINAKFDTWE